MLVTLLLICTVIQANCTNNLTSCTRNPEAQCEVDGCIACVEGNTRECKTCGPDYTLNPDTKQCTRNPEVQCNTPNCKTCDNPKTDREVCTECNGDSYLTPTSQCVPDCTAIGGYYGDSADRKCKKCSSECAGCVGPASNQCSACPAGRALTYSDAGHPGNGGACGDACAADKNGCKACGAKIGGTDYCSHCSDNAQAPLNGNCATSSARVAFCAAMGAGVCTKCAAGYFLQDGGCYETNRQPGKQVCTLAGGTGECETCANGRQPNSGACPSCHPTCKTCRDTDSADACTMCAAGYYMLGSGPEACVSCEADSGSVKGVSGCLSCAPPSGNTGPVLCYLTKDDGTGGSTNRSGLSTGAIAGISVAVVIVVGGLVGFLCWWFLCRGKA
ncbi:VSP [Giardia lamblia P15]|uniref:VSP n=1 Tax=Giardia intestinalis (strain P15) TaxID=658858 RepID=E1EZ44_GIAIA|nr:VSP [Giardia lamblia P15]